jgi:hypothetical protein
VFHRVRRRRGLLPRFGSFKLALQRATIVELDAAPAAVNQLPTAGDAFEQIKKSAVEAVYAVGCF